MPEFVELIEAAGGIVHMLRSSGGEMGPQVFQTVYMPPAMRLRNEADRIDRDDAAIARFRKALLAAQAITR